MFRLFAKTIVVGLILTIPFTTYSQNQKVVFYNSDWKIIRHDFGIKYFGIVKEDSTKKGIFQLFDYYLSGNLQMSGFCDCREKKLELKDFKSCDEDGKATGEWIWYYENGKKSRNNKYENGKLVGKTYEFYDSGKIKQESDLSDGVNYRLYKLYFENGQLKAKLGYKDTIMEGSHKHYYENGQQAYSATYLNGKKNGIIKGWYDNGQLAYTHEYNQEGRSIGQAKEWYKSGNIKSTRFYNQQGELIGNYDGWYENEQQKYHIVYLIDHRISESTYWNEKGEKTFEKNATSYNNWHSNGQLKFKGQYDKLGRKHGTWYEWNKDGSIKKEQQFKHGDFVGKDQFEMSDNEEIP